MQNNQKKSSCTFLRIYQAVKEIPRGETRSYGEIAKIAQTHPRVVGMALHRNPDPKTIPCHRVVFKNGKCSKSFAFGGMDGQKALLEKENVFITTD